MLTFSIIVPIYNVAPYLEDCIKSILRQTYTNFELILVDDGSTDVCYDIYSKYQLNDKRIKVIRKNNGGLVSARKAGAAIASGEYILCVDSDDWVSDNYLADIYKVIELYHPDVISFNYTEVISSKRYKRNNKFRKGYYSRSDLVNEILPSLISTFKDESFPTAIWAKAYKRDIYKEEQMAVCDDIKIGEDAACSIPCVARAKDMYVLDSSLYFYRHNNKSMTRNRKPFVWNGPELIYKHLNNRLNNSDIDYKSQINRRTVHAIMNVVKTQFYRNESYFNIVKDIKINLNTPVYNSILDKNEYAKFSLMSFFHFFLKHRIMFPLYLLSRVK